MASQHGVDRPRSRGNHPFALGPGGLRAGAAVGRRGAEPRHRDLPDLSRAADAPVPTALLDDLEAPLAGLPQGPDSRLPVFHGALLDVAPDGLLQDDPART